MEGEGGTKQGDRNEVMGERGNRRSREPEMRGEGEQTKQGERNRVKEEKGGRRSEEREN